MDLRCPRIRQFRITAKGERACAPCEHQQIDGYPCVRLRLALRSARRGDHLQDAPSEVLLAALNCELVRPQKEVRLQVGRLNKCLNRVQGYSESQVSITHASSDEISCSPSLTSRVEL